MAQSRILVTGATGTVGSEVVKQLVELGERVREGMLATGVPEVNVGFILRYFAAVRNGKMYPPTSAVSNLLGRPPRTFDEWARDHADALRL